MHQHMYCKFHSDPIHLQSTTLPCLDSACPLVFKESSRLPTPLQDHVRHRTELDMDWPHAGRTLDDRLIDPGGEWHSDIDMLSCPDCDEVGDDAADRRCGRRVQEPSHRARVRDRAARGTDANDEHTLLCNAAHPVSALHPRSGRNPPPDPYGRSRGDPGHQRVDERAAAGDECPDRADGGGTAGDPGGGGGAGAAEGVSGQVQRDAAADGSAALHPRQRDPVEDDTADRRLDLPDPGGLHAILPRSRCWRNSSRRRHARKRRGRSGGS